MAERTLFNVSHLGLGEILRTYKLNVPPNQREYSWTEKEVTTLLQDYALAIHEGGSDYFLGTIVVVAKGGNDVEIVDGQQRLATNAILFAAIRAYLQEQEPVIAETIKRDFLTASSTNMRELEPRIRLNLADNQFFEGIICGKTLEPTRASHELIAGAYTTAQAHIKKIVAQYDAKRHGDLLVEWIKFIQYSAQVVMLSISSEGNAYRMFETLNDRGLKTTQADLVKNYLFGRAGQRINEAQDRWSAMRGVLDTLDEDRVPTVVFLRHVLMLRRGYFRENALHDNIQKEVKSVNQAASLLDWLETQSTDYAALFNPESERWNGYPDAMRESIKVLDLLNIASMRPLMHAVAAKFTKPEATSTFRKFISWKVRYLIAGATLTGGYIEVPIANTAKKVFDGDIVDTRTLSKEMASRIPGNDQFKNAFAEATISKTSLARYYLRSLEVAAQGLPDPCFMPTNDRETINLEHILPLKPMDNWPSFSEADAKLDCKRLGNMALLQAKKNSDLRSAGFDEKKKVFAHSPYELTIQLAAMPDWNHEHVVQRQALLADLALKAWPL